MRKKKVKTSALLALAAVLISGGFIALNASCSADSAPEEEKSTSSSEGAQREPVQDKDLTVDFAEVQWSDINSTTAATRTVLEGLGYETTSKMVAVPIAFNAVSTNDIDVFLGDWEPSMKSIRTPLLEDGTIEDYHTNLTGAKYTLAVPQYVADAGVTNFADIADHAGKFNSRIYGIEPGNDGNQLISSMIQKDAFGLGSFELIESSEAGMLTEVKGKIQDEEWIVFLGWAPHPMNTTYDIAYLAGGDDYFGPDYGAATVHTITRTGYGEENPNLGRFFKNLEFTLDMEGEIMKDIADGMKARKAAEKWLKANPQILDTWLDGVKTVEGKPGVPAVREHLNI